MGRKTPPPHGSRSQAKEGLVERECFKAARHWHSGGRSKCVWCRGWSAPRQERVSLICWCHDPPPMEKHKRWANIVAWWIFVTGDKSIRGRQLPGEQQHFRGLSPTICGTGRGVDCCLQLSHHAIKVPTVRRKVIH